MKYLLPIDMPVSIRLLKIWVNKNSLLSLIFSLPYASKSFFYSKFGGK